MSDSDLRDVLVAAVLQRFSLGDDSSLVELSAVVHAPKGAGFLSWAHFTVSGPSPHFGAMRLLSSPAGNSIAWFAFQP